MPCLPAPARPPAPLGALALSFSGRVRVVPPLSLLQVCPPACPACPARLACQPSLTEGQNLAAPDTRSRRRSLTRRAHQPAHHPPPTILPLTTTTPPLRPLPLLPHTTSIPAPVSRSPRSTHSSPRRPGAGSPPLHFFHPASAILLPLLSCLPIPAVARLSCPPDKTCHHGPNPLGARCRKGASMPSREPQPARARLSPTTRPLPTEPLLPVPRACLPACPRARRGASCRHRHDPSLPSCRSPPRPATRGFVSWHAAPRSLDPRARRPASLARSSNASRASCPSSTLSGKC